MRILSISLTNIYAHASTEVDLTGVSRVCIVGDNDSGKSSFIDGMLFAIFGTAAARGTTKQVIRQGELEGKSVVIWESGGHTYRAIRIVDKHKHLASLHRRLPNDGWEEVSSARVREVDLAIQQVVGMDYEDFLSGAYWSQDPALDRNMLTAKPTERRLFFARLLGVADFREYEMEAWRIARSSPVRNLADVEQDITDLQEEIKKHRSERESVSLRISETRESEEKLSQEIAGLDVEIRTVEGNLHRSELIKRVQSELEEIGPAQFTDGPSRDVLKAQFDAATSEFTRFELINYAIHEFDRELAVFCGHVDRWEQESVNRAFGKVLRGFKTRAETESQRLRTGLSTLEDQLARLSMRPEDCSIDSCAFIRAALGAKRKVPIQQHLLKEQLADLQLVDESNLRFREMGSPTLDISQLRSRIDHDVAGFNRARVKVEMDRTKLLMDSLQEKLREAQQLERHVFRIKRLLAELTKLKSQMVPTELKEKSISALSERRNFCKGTLKRAQQKLLELVKLDAELRTKLGAMERREGPLDAELEWAKSAGRRKLIAEIGHGFFKECPSLLANRAAQSIEISMNTSLQEIAPRYRFRIDLEGESLSPEISTPNGEMPMQLLCGSAKFRVGLAWRLSLGELFRQRSGAQVDTMILDEAGFGSLDPQRLEQVRWLIQEVSDRYGLIIVVSHIPQIQSLFETKIVTSRISDREVTAVREG